MSEIPLTPDKHFCPRVRIDRAAGIDARNRLDQIGIGAPQAIGVPVRVEGRLRECLDLIEPTDRLLDVGCSSAWLAAPILAKGVQNYVGLDRHVNRREELGPNITLVAGSALELPFSNMRFGAVCMFDVIEHLPRHTEVEALREAYRVLRPGGYLYLSTPHASWPHTPVDPAWLLGHRHYRKSTITNLLNASGFRVERTFVAGGIIEGLDHLRLLIYKHIFQRPSPHIGAITRLIDRSHGRNHRLGMTLFAVGSKSSETIQV